VLKTKKMFINKYFFLKEIASNLLKDIKGESGVLDISCCNCQLPTIHAIDDLCSKESINLQYEDKIMILFLVVDELYTKRPLVHKCLSYETLQLAVFTGNKRWLHRYFWEFWSRKIQTAY
jgi:hypothetical protein